MTKLYHAVPIPMDGTVLYPLNQLRTRSQALYDQHARKYAGRERLMQKTVPPLDCLWNDTLFLTAVHPQDLHQALTAAGGTPKTRSFFEIDSARLDPALATIFRYRKAKIFEDFTDDDFAPFDAENLAACRRISSETKAYYAEMYAGGKRPLQYHLTPHILYRGTIETKNLPVITV